MCAEGVKRIDRSIIAHTMLKLTCDIGHIAVVRFVASDEAWRKRHHHNTTVDFLVKQSIDSFAK